MFAPAPSGAACRPGRARRLAERLGATRFGVLAIGHVVSPLQKRLLLVSGGRLSLTGRLPVLLLTTRGRRTRQPRTVPLIRLDAGERLVVCNVSPGFEQVNPWVLNLLADPRATVQVGARCWEVVARPATEAELDDYWPRLVARWPAFDTFHRRGGQRTVFVLEPAVRPGQPRSSRSATTDP